MDDFLNSAGSEQAPAPQSPDAVDPSAAPNLGQGEQQAPSPTPGGVEGGKPASEPEQRTVSYEEYEKLKAQFEEKDTFVSRLKEMAEANLAQDEWNNFKNERATQIRQAIEQSNGDDEAMFAAISQVLSGTLDSVRDDFNSKFTDYQAQMQGWASDFEWQNTRDQEAERLIATYGLNPAIKPKLLEAPTREDMTKNAETAKYLNDLYASQGVQNAIAQQEQQRRNSGVDNISVGGGMPPRTELKPGNADEPHLRAALKNALGIS